MGVAIKHETVSWGILEVILSVNIVDFFCHQKIPKLQDESTKQPVVKAVGIKVYCHVSNIIYQEELIEMIQLLIPFYKAPVVVIHTYAAYVTEHTCLQRRVWKEFATQ
jgi:Cse1